MKVRVARASPYVGRDRELFVVGRLIEQLNKGVGGVLVIKGAPGIGKSRLLDELCNRAGLLGHQIHKAHAAEFERELPFGIFLVALEDRVCAEASSLRSKLSAPQIRDLAAVFPGLGDRENRPVRVERYRSYRAVRALLSDFCRESPLVLALDDVQWVDPGSAELLAHLVHSPISGPALIVVSLRSGPLPEVLRASLQTALRDGGAEMLELQALSDADASKILVGRLDEKLHADIVRESQGNPFYLEELARATARKPVKETASLPGLPVPEPVRMAIQSELASLSQNARRLAQAGSVVGDPFDLDMSREVLGAAETQVTKALDELLEWGIVHETGVARRLRFRHPLVRRAVYDLAGHGWRLLAHRQLADTLKAAGAGPLAIAPHMEAYSSVGDEEAVAVLVKAAEATSDPLTAARWIDAAVRLLPSGSGYSVRRIEMLSLRSIRLGEAGRFQEAQSALEAILKELPTELHHLRPKLRTAWARLNVFTSRFDQLESGMQQALEEALDAPLEAAEYKVTIALGLAFTGGDRERARRLAAEACGMAETAGDPHVSFRVSSVGAAVESLFPDRAQPLVDVASATESLETLSDAQLLSDLEFVIYLGLAGHNLDLSVEALDCLDRGVDLARRAGLHQLSLIMQLTSLLPMFAVGRLREAAEVSNESVEMARLGENKGILAFALASRCIATWATGDLAAALTAGGEGERLLIHSPAPRLHRAMLGWAYPEALVEVGELRTACDSLAPALDACDVSGWAPGFTIRTLEVAVRAYLGIGDVATARIRANEATQISAGLGLPMADALAARCAASVALHERRFDAAAAHARSSSALADLATAPFESARAKLLEAVALRRSGDRDSAVNCLVNAEEIFALCGALGYRRFARAELRRLGDTRILKTRDGPLTPRERQVAGLLAAGLSNRAIAAELFVSLKTVETHVARLFAKLHVSDRRMVADALARTAPPEEASQAHNGLGPVRQSSSLT
jgi:DNA-binding CsgD family transcriptional regulator